MPTIYSPVLPEEQTLPAGTRVVRAEYWPPDDDEELILGRVADPAGAEHDQMAELGAFGSIVVWDSGERRYEYHDDLRILTEA